jgi:hypothetical protein
LSAARLQRFGFAVVTICSSGCKPEIAAVEPPTLNPPPAAAPSAPVPATAPTAPRVPTPPVQSPAEATPEASLFGRPDEPLRHVLGSARIVRVRKGTGGRSLAFKLYFENDIAGYFKPEQTFAANWYSEIASYHLDRELGLGRVPPTIGRRIEWEQLRPVAGADDKIEEVVVRDGRVRGSVVFWISDPPVPLELPRGWESWLRLEGTNQVSPFQRVDDYKRQRGSMPGSPTGAPGMKTLAVAEPSAPEFADRPAELSDLILFDYLIANIDRWGGGQTNVRVLSRSKPLIYLDNANGFAPQAKPSPVNEARLTALHRFRTKTIEALRALDLGKFRERLASDPLAPVLSEKQLAELEQRRERVLEHVAEMQQRYGARALAW